jgi:hypothetical protein
VGAEKLREPPPPKPDDGAEKVRGAPANPPADGAEKLRVDGPNVRGPG